MLDIIIAIIILGIVVERATELIHASKIFLPVRNWVALIAYPPDALPLGKLALWVRISTLRFRVRKWRVEVFHVYHPDLEWMGAISRHIATFMNDILGCGYCTSVWVAMLFAWFCPLPRSIVLCPVMDWVIKVVLLHGVSNLFHVLYEGRRKWFTHPRPVHLMIDVQGLGIEEDGTDV